MFLLNWDKLPASMQKDAVRKYYEILSYKKASLFMKRLFDIGLCVIMLIVLLPVVAIIAAAVVIDSPGGAFLFQERVTAYGRHFKIMKFRTMVTHAEKIGLPVTAGFDKRITRVGRFLRDTRLDEISQLINILKGDMTFVGTRPEVPEYVDRYTDEMMATLLLPAGVTSEASIMFRDEHKLLSASEGIEEVYINNILPIKMKYNIEAIKEFGFLNDIKTLGRTVNFFFGRLFSR